MALLLANATLASGKNDPQTLLLAAMSIQARSVENNQAGDTKEDSHCNTGK